MEKRRKVILRYENEVTEQLLLSEEQLKLLEYLFNYDYLGDDTDYDILNDEEFTII